MTIEIKAPTFPESIADGSIATWHVKQGESVSRDEPLVDIETDKVTLEVVAPADGVLIEIIEDEGATVLSDALIGKFEPGAVASASNDSAAAKPVDDAEPASTAEVSVAPAARSVLEEAGLDASSVTGTGRGGLITKEDAVAAAAAKKAAPAPKKASAAKEQVEAALVAGERVERRVPMTRMRTRIAERLLEASQNTAMLTTFNEVNMAPIMQLRKQYKDQFENAHNGTKLGFMGFFVKAATESLKRFPAVNASIDGGDVVYHGYQDVGVAVSSEKGLVVPVLRDAEHMSLAQIEDKIRDFGVRAKGNKLTIEEMSGGTFTVSNGGVFGSLLSTPIINPPQTAILGMHKIQERPMAVNGEVKILPMMYLALSYDHRLIDGKEAVQFLVAIKDMIEDPARILLEI